MKVLYKAKPNRNGNDSLVQGYFFGNVMDSSSGTALKSFRITAHPFSNYYM